MTQEIRVAYLSVEKTANKSGFIGGLLIIDSRGIPLEFMCTHAVKPTDTQRSLYGDSLKAFVSVDLCGRRLLEKAGTPPVLVLTKETEMLGMRHTASYPMISLRKLQSPEGSYKDIISNKIEVQSAEAPVLQVACCRQNPDDWKIAEPILRELAMNLDVMEPFKRIETALQSLSAKDERFA